MRFLRLTTAYDGTEYAGWQFQPGQPTIQEKLESAWKTVTGESIRISASGRTDAGVHAWGQVCSMVTQSSMDCDSLRRALNANLPDDIVIESIAEAPANFHAIRDAVCKTYRYRIVAGRTRDVMDRRFACFVPSELDFETMQQASRLLVGRRDFSSFQAAGSLRQSTVRSVFRVEMDQHVRLNRQYIHLDITADGFLYNMVRIMAGSLIHLGRGVRDIGWLERGVAACQRSAVGPTAPGRGLCLMSVCYEDHCACGAGECLGKNQARSSRLQSDDSGCPQ